MKAKLRKEQKERMKTSTSNIQNNTSSENKSQDNNNNEHKKKRARNKSVEMPKGFFSNESIPNSKNTQNNQINPSLNQIDINPINQIDKEDNKEQDLSKIATMFNFEIDKEKDIIKIKENDEYYDMRNQIIQLEKELENTHKEYNTLLNQYEKKMN